jgi:chitosanase
MVKMRFSIREAALVATIGLASATPSSIHGASFNDPNAGPPASLFAAAPTLPVARIVSAAAAATKVPEAATFVLGGGRSEKATIHSDWAGFSKVRWNICLSNITT